MKKKAIAPLTNIAVSAPLEGFGNLMRKTNNNPNSVTRNKLNHASLAVLIQPYYGCAELKKSQKSREEIMKPLAA